MGDSLTSSRLARWFAPETLVQSIGIGLLLTVVSRVAALGRGVVFARLMDRAELGTWALTSNTMQMLSVVLVFGIPAGLCRYAARHQRTCQLRSFLVRSLGVSFGLCAAVCCAGILLCPLLAQFIYEDPAQAMLAALLCIGSLALVAMNLFQGAMQGLRVNRINAVMLVVQSLGFAALTAVLFVCWRPTALAAAIVFVVMSVGVTIVPACMLWRLLRGEVAGAERPVPAGVWRQLLAYSLGTWGSSALFSLWTWLDRYMLLHCDTIDSTACLEQLGTYHIVENLTIPLQALGAGWSVQVLAHTVHLWESGRNNEAGDQVRLATKLSVLVLMFAASALVVLKRLVLVDIFGDRSFASGEILELGLVVAIILVAQCMIRCWVLCHERAWVVSVVWVVAVAGSFALNLVLIPSLHLKGAAITAVVSAAASTALQIWFSHLAGLRLDRGTYVAVMLPLALLLPPPFMLATLAVVVLSIPWTEWLFSDKEKARLNDVLPRLAARRVGSPNLTAM